MIKTGKVTEVIAAKTWNGPNGTVYYSKITFDNGDNGEIGKKSENAVKVGDSITYTLEAGQYGNKIKEVRDNNAPAQSGGGTGNGGGRVWSPESDKWPSFSLAYAKDTIVGMLETNNETLSKMNSQSIADATLAVADRYLDWLKKQAS